MSTESAPKKDSTAANKGKSNQAQSTATGLPKESTTTPKKKLSPVPSGQTSATPTKQPLQKLSRDHSSNRSSRAGSVSSPIKGPQTLQSVSIPSKSSTEDGATSTDDTPTKEAGATPQFLSPLFFLLGLILALTPIQPVFSHPPPVSHSPSLTLYSRPDYHGSYIRLRAPHGCVQLPRPWDNIAASVRTSLACVQLYTEPHCTGKVMRVGGRYPLEEGRNLDPLGFYDSITSVGPCRGDYAYFRLFGHYPHRYGYSYYDNYYQYDGNYHDTVHDSYHDTHHLYYPDSFDEHDIHDILTDDLLDTYYDDDDADNDHIIDIERIKAIPIPDHIDIKHIHITNQHDVHIPTHGLDQDIDIHDIDGVKDDIPNHDVHIPTHGFQHQDVDISHHDIVDGVKDIHDSKHDLHDRIKDIPIPPSSNKFDFHDSLNSHVDVGADKEVDISHENIHDSVKEHAFTHDLTDKDIEIPTKHDFSAIKDNIKDIELPNHDIDDIKDDIKGSHFDDVSIPNTHKYGDIGSHNIQTDDGIDSEVIDSDVSKIDQEENVVAKDIKVEANTADLGVGDKIVNFVGSALGAIGR